MANGNEHRLGPFTRSDCRSDRLAGVNEIARTSTLHAGRLEGTDQHTLGNADCRQVRQQAEMAGESEPPGMRIAVSITDQTVGSIPEFPPRLESAWGFSERKQAGDVGKLGPHPDPGRLDDLKPRQAQQDDRGEQPWRSLVVGDIHPAHNPKGPLVLIQRDDFRAEVLLDTNCFLRCDIPAV